MACVAGTKDSRIVGHAGERSLNEDCKKILEEGEVEGVNTAFAMIMEKHKPDPWGKGHVQLYMLATVCFLNSTMSGASLPSPFTLLACLLVVCAPSNMSLGYLTY